MPNRQNQTPNQKTGGKPNHANQNSNHFNRTPNNRNNEQRQFTPRNNGQNRNNHGHNKGNNQSSTLKNFNDGKPVEFEPDPEKGKSVERKLIHSKNFMLQIKNINLEELRKKIPIQNLFFRNFFMTAYC